MSQADWAAALAAGRYLGAPHDIADGFIHFSAGPQVAETLAKHYAGRDDLVLIGVDPADLGDALKWEISRGGALFPHLYAPLDITHVRSVHTLKLDANSAHILPAELFA